MKAKKKTLEVLKPRRAGRRCFPQVDHLESRGTRQAQGRVKVPDPKTLLDKLRNDAKVL